MEYLIGVVLAVALFALAMVVGFDRDRVFYPMLLIVIASYYILFAVAGGSVNAMLSSPSLRAPSWWWRLRGSK
jgi:hypothetical protein